jgi:GNAT superfamily N-acetyltransferase
MPADVSGLFKVRTSVRENILTREEMMDLGITEASVSAMIQASCCAWVASDEGQIVGFSMIIPQEACLFAAFVLPEWEGMGIGKKLVGMAEEALFSQHQTLWLETGKHTRAAAFYRHLGWRNETNVGNGDIRLEKHRA